MKKLLKGTLRSKIRFLELKNELLEENHCRLNEIYKENARLYHDMNHHLQIISWMAQKAGNTEIVDYTASISEPIRQLPDMIWSGFDLVDAILNHALALAQAKGILMDVNVEFPNPCAITADDLCVMLFNLLDNALEHTAAADKAGGASFTPVILVSIRRIEQFLMIKVQNPCRELKKNGFGWFFTTKANPLGHGIGLQNVRKTAEKYGGNLETSIQDGVFTAAVLVFLNE